MLYVNNMIVKLIKKDKQFMHIIQIIVIIKLVIRSQQKKILLICLKLDNLKLSKKIIKICN